MQINWNLTDKIRKYRKADVLIISVAKSGRTWLRMLISKYLSLHFNTELSIADLNQPLPEMPKIMYTHERWSHLVEAKKSQQLFGRYIIPENVSQSKKLIVFYRDPRDVVVSLFFEKTKRASDRIEMTLPEFIRHPKYGIECIIQAMNHWYERFDNHPACLWGKYENLKADPEKILGDTLDFIGIDNIDPKLVHEAVEFCKFENMKKMEASDAFNTPILRPGNPNDPNSFKVREGKVGGYVKHFADEDLVYLDKRMNYLNSFFGYSID